MTNNYFVAQVLWLPIPVVGTVPGTVNTAVKETKYLHLGNLHSSFLSNTTLYPNKFAKQSIALMSQ